MNYRNKEAHPKPTIHVPMVLKPYHCVVTSIPTRNHSFDDGTDGTYEIHFRTCLFHNCKQIQHSSIFIKFKQFWNFNPSSLLQLTATSTSRSYGIRYKEQILRFFRGVICYGDLGCLTKSLISHKRKRTMKFWFDELQFHCFRSHRISGSMVKTLWILPQKMS